MSAPKVGDRVRIVVEGEVAVAGWEGRWVDVGDSRFVIGEDGVVSIEVIPEPFVLPTKRWAQIVDGLGNLWTRVELSDESPIPWINTLDGYYTSDDKISQFSGLRVISEGVDA